MKVTFDEYLEACDRSAENPDIPMPIPCASCEDEMMEYDEDNDELMRITVMYYVLLKSEKLGLDFGKAWNELRITEIRDKYSF